MHLPVLKEEILEYLAPKSNQNFIDATIGLGGHAIEILREIKPKGKLLGIEIDKEVYQALKEKIEKDKSLKKEIRGRLILVNSSFTRLKEIVEKENFKKVSGILFDLGLCSWHLEKGERGFTFKKNELLDMRFSSGDTLNLTAEEIINKYSKEKLERIFKEYGNERFSKKIAREIVEERKKGPIKTTFQLVEIIKRATPRWYHLRKIHPATKVFQALRITVNKELKNLKKALPQALEILDKGGRMAVISFHSLEDKIVKDFFKENISKIKILTKKPVTPTLEEIKKNPRSRSAKLRVAQKI